MSIEAMKQALDALENKRHEYRAYQAITALRQAIAQAEKQAATIEDNSQDWAKLDGAVAWHLIERHADNWADIGKMMDEYVAAKLAKRGWVGLTNDDLRQIILASIGVAEAKLKEKNNG